MAVSDRARARAAALCLSLAALSALVTRAAAEPPALSDAQVLGASIPAFRIESVQTRVTSYIQDGHGYQSQAGNSVLGPGSERMTVLEPQIEVIASQGARLKHRFWMPVDVVTAASPDAIDKNSDVISGASRHNVAGTFDWTATYAASPSFDVSMRNGLHLEENFRSWHGGLSVKRGFADDNTVLSAGVLQVLDWFDRFDIIGKRHGRTSRSGTTGSVGLTQILTPATVVHLNYGLTAQSGELGNTWNSVPLATGERGGELLPAERVRHALVGRASQFLPWNGALRVYYRFYADDWGIVAHSIEGELMQRLSPALYVGGLYRFHTQTGADFFTTLAPVDSTRRTADSDLAPLDSYTLGAKLVADVPLVGTVRALHFEIGYERYVRSNDLRMNIVTWASGYRF